MKTTILEAKELKKVYAHGDQETHALRGVSVAIRSGEMTSIMGPSGSGKSTLLHMLGGLDRPSSGEVLIGGENIAALTDDALSAFRRRKLGFIFQFFNLLPTLTALENVALPLLLDGQPLSKVTPRAKELLDFMGLSARMNHRPEQLSGGQMQRVAIARALVTDPLLILADEPTGNLDSETGHSVLEMLSKLVREKGQTVVMVTHDPKAANYGDRIVRVKDGMIESDVAVKIAKVPPIVNGDGIRHRVPLTVIG
jgi:putative ABC transport system ATP-binding protein